MASACSRVRSSRDTRGEASSVATAFSSRSSSASSARSRVASRSRRGCSRPRPRRRPSRRPPVGDRVTAAAHQRRLEPGRQGRHQLLHGLALEVGGLVALARGLLVGPADRAEALAGERVLDAAADRAGAADGQAAGELGRHPGDPLLAQVEVGLAQVLGVVGGLASAGRAPRSARRSARPPRRRPPARARPARGPPGRRRRARPAASAALERGGAPWRARRRSSAARCVVRRSPPSSSRATSAVEAVEPRALVAAAPARGGARTRRRRAPRRAG